MSLESKPKAVADIQLPEVDFIISTDASESDWWDTNNISPGGIWGKRISYQLLRIEGYIPCSHSI